NLLEPGPDSVRQIELPFPVIDNDDLAKLIHINDDGDRPHLASKMIFGLYPSAGGGAALKEALNQIRQEASEAIAEGARILILSDCGSHAEWWAIPPRVL